MKTTASAFCIHSSTNIRTIKPWIARDPPVFLSASSDLDYAMQQSNLLYDLQPRGVVILVAIVLGVLSQVLINSMLKGDQGLSAFLSDGKGYGKSRFRPYNKGKDYPKEDPLPWLKLPKFSYVEVKGQDTDNMEVDKDDTEMGRKASEEVRRD